MTKRLLPYLLTAFLSMVGLNAFAHDIEVKNADGVTIYYNWINNKTELAVSFRGNDSDSYSNEYSGNVVIPESVKYGGKTYRVTSIWNRAFENCSGLTSVTIPNGVTSIGYYAFEHCSNLASITIPNSVTDIGLGAFWDTAWYNNQPDGFLYVGKYLFGCKGKMANLIIKEGTTKIAHSCCEGNSYMHSLVIPNSVKFMDSYAFYDTGLTTVISEIEKPSYECYGDFFFDNGSPPMTLIVPKGTKAAYQNTAGWNIFSDIIEVGDKGSVFEVDGIYYRIGDNNTVAVAFGNTERHSDFVIPSQVEFQGTTYSVMSIDGTAFSGCSALTSVTIPNSVTSIGNSVFRGCSGLTSIKIESGNKVYDSRNNCNAIIETSSNSLIAGCKNTTIPNGVTSIGSEAFYDCSSLTSVSIPNGVTSIGDYAFYDCSSLTSVTIPNSVTSIGESAFYNCSSLTSVTIPNSVTSIGWSTFLNCSGLASVTIPNSVTSIGGCAFSGCSSLTSVTIPNSVKSIERDAFSGTAWLNNQPDGLVYAGKVAYKYKGEMADNTHITLKEGTTGIAGEAFSHYTSLTSIIIPNSVTSIGSYAFWGCSGLTSITIPNSVTSIEWDAFWGCSGLTSVSIPNSVTSIGGYAFHGCRSLTSITIPSSVTSIGQYAFDYCKGLTTIVSEIEKPFEIESNTFDTDTYNVAELIVPYGTRSAYQDTEGWKKFTMITEAADEDAVAFTIDGIAYEGSKSEKNVMVKAVDTTMASIEIPASVSYEGITFQVSGITDGVFDGSSMAALIWNVESALTNSAFNNTSIGSNFLLYVKSSSYAPSSVKNVVVDGTAQKIVLSDDGGQFYCPQAFTARSISYTHNYSMETGIGKAKGWETIALPFDVQKISHNTRGEIVPFSAYNSSSNLKPFWLANFSGSSFRRTAAVLANEPYIIAMPNSSSYRNEYNLAGEVTFSADNVQVPKTPSFSGTFMPAFATVAKSSSVYAMNVNNRSVKYSGSYDAGSRFISGLREVHPFEAYMTGSFSRGVIEINFDDGTTSLNEELRMKNEESAGATDGEIVIYSLSGQQVARTSQRDFDAVWQQLPKGVYIINGKKWIK